jgi:hypothetical protein
MYTVPFTRFAVCPERGVGRCVSAPESSMLSQTISPSWGSACNIESQAANTITRNAVSYDATYDDYRALTSTENDRWEICVQVKQ